MNNTEKSDFDSNIRPLQPKVEADWPDTPPIPRPYNTAFEPKFLSDYHSGVMKYIYKGFPCLKSPIDLAIYMLLIHDQKPGSIIEIGSFHGGAALFYNDLCGNYGLDTEIVTVDFRSLGDARDPNSPIEFIQADALHLESSPLHDRLNSLPRPWLVIEDSAHTRDVTFAVMEYFKDRMQTGEYLIIEDGVIEDQNANKDYGGGPNLAVHDFFVKHPEAFYVDEHYNDFFGKNASFNPNGYLRKI